MKIIVITSYFSALILLSIYGAHVYWLIFWHRRVRERTILPTNSPAPLPVVTVQLPFFNEPHVARRLIDAVAGFDYPAEKLEIQVLDDSQDETQRIASDRVAYWQKRGRDIQYLRRRMRVGFKAGALAYGLARARGELVAVFDADNLPPSDFLRKMVGEFRDPGVGMVQARWGHLNLNRTLLTRAQALYLDGHFLIEQLARSAAGVFFNFNGTAGIWRVKTIRAAGGWSADTLTEDLDLSYRAQMAGWRFVFRPDVVVPSELPNDARAFKSQQYRWAKGAVQTARKILPPLWRSRSPLKIKMAASMHLTNKVISLLMILMTILLMPALWYRWQGGWVKFALVDLPMFVLATGSMGVFYRHVQQATGQSTDGLWWRMPLLMSVGVGLTVTNARAVIEGIFGGTGQFVRTPKSGIIGPGTPQRTARITFQKTTIVEAFCGIYSVTAIAAAAYQGLWMAIPFMATFAIGYLYLAWQGIAPSLRHPPSAGKTG